MKKFIEQRYHLHVLVGAIIAIAIHLGLVGLSNLFGYLYDEAVLTTVIMECFAVTILAGCREVYYYVRKAPFDKWDIIWSSIGSILGSLLIIWIL